MLGASKGHGASIVNVGMSLLSPPLFSTQPTIGGGNIGDTLALTEGVAGPNATLAIVEFTLDDVDKTGELVGLNWDSTGESAGLLALQVSATNASGTVLSDRVTRQLTEAAGVIAQTADIGALTPAGTGGFQPTLGSGAVDPVVSYNSLTSGSLGAYTPAVSSGRLVFNGAAGGPDGAVINITGQSGRVYDVTITQEAGVLHVASDADIDLGAGVGANVDRHIKMRQNAQIATRNHVTSNAWLSATSNAQTTMTRFAPIIVEGEGNHIAGEHHIGGWRGFPTDNFTVRNVLLPNDIANAQGFIFEATRAPIGLTVEGCTAICDVPVDGGGFDWSGGYGTTGLGEKRFVYVTSGHIESIVIRNNYVSGWYIQFETQIGHYFEFVGNYMVGPYYDYRKTSAPTGVRRRMEGFNFYGDPLEYSVNETPETEPHLDMDQVKNGGPGTLPVDQYANISHAVNGVGFQRHFQADRPSTQTGGHHVTARGDMLIGGTPHALSNDYPEDCLFDRLLFVGKHGANPINSTFNRALFGTSKAGDGGEIGTQTIQNSGIGPTGTIVYTPTVIETNLVNTPAFTEAQMAAALTNYADIATLPAKPTYAEVLATLTPTAAGALDGISPQPLITLPGVGQPMSEASLSAAYAPAPTLTNLTVVDSGTADFTIDSDIEANPFIYWAYFDTAVTNPEHIRRGFTDTVDAVAYGYAGRAGAGTISSGGPATIADGTYHLCIASYNTHSRSTVVTQEVTAPQAAANPPTQVDASAGYMTALANFLTDSNTYVLTALANLDATATNTTGRWVQVQGLTNAYIDHSTAELRAVIRNGTGTTIGERRWPITRGTLTRMVLAVDADKGILKYFENGVEITPNSTATTLSASSGPIGLDDALYMVDASARNNKMAADSLSQFMVATDATIARLGETTGVTEAQAIAALDASMQTDAFKTDYAAKAAFIRGDADTATEWNSTTHSGTAGVLGAATGFVALP